jgi:hypothetical protein
MPNSESKRLSNRLGKRRLREQGSERTQCEYCSAQPAIINGRVTARHVDDDGRKWCPGSSTRVWV